METPAIAQPKSNTQLNGPWLLLGRGVWSILVIVTLLLWAVGTAAIIREPLNDCAVVVCDPVEVNAGDRETILDLNLPLTFLTSGFNFALTIVSGVIYFVIAGVIFWRKSDDWMGLLVSFMLIFLGGVFFTSSNDALLRTYPGAGPVHDLILLIGMISIFLLSLLFPDGRFVPRRSRWLALLLIAGSVIVDFLSASLDSTAGESDFWMVPLAVTAVAAQSYRYIRVSKPTERQQTKWVLVGLAGTIATAAVWIGLALLYPPDQSSSARIYALLVAVPLIVFFSLLLPLSFAFSILRYRLWDIDLLINRTLVYGAMTAILVLLYFGSVVLLQALFGAISGQQSAVAIVISTLVIAALFNPLRRRVQDFIDRRFFRRKYDAVQTLERFAITARDEVDLDRLSAELVRVVQETMQPERALLWLKDAGAGTSETLETQEFSRR